MWKRLVGLCFSIAAAMFAGIQANAQDTYVDQCLNTQQNSARVCYGFTSMPDFSAVSGWNLHDDGVLLPQNAQSEIIYTISGSELLEVCLYIEDGSYAMWSKGSYRLGGMLQSINEAVRLSYDRVRDCIFFQRGGQTYALRFERGEQHVFRPEAVEFNHNAYYGLNVEVSKNGVNYTPLEAKFVSVRSQEAETGQGTSYQEIYSVKIPSEITHIKIRLQNYRTMRTDTALELTPGPYAMLLSQVAFSGASLVLGVPSDSSSEPADPSSKPEIPSSSDSDSTSVPETSSSDSASSSKEISWSNGENYSESAETQQRILNPRLSADLQCKESTQITRDNSKKDTSTSDNEQPLPVHYENRVEAAVEPLSYMEEPSTGQSYPEQETSLSEQTDGIVYAGIVSAGAMAYIACILIQHMRRH